MLKLENFELHAGHNDLITVGLLDVPHGSKALIVGGNNSGKTLLLQAINGDYRNYSGKIFVMDELLDGRGKRLTILIENQNHLLLKETVWKNITLPLSTPSKWQLNRIEEMIFLTDLEDRLNEPAEHLSQSARKFIELIRAVAQFPGLILIDDLDTYFDELNLVKALGLCDIALSGGSSLLATSRQMITDFEQIYRIQHRELVAR